MQTFFAWVQILICIKSGSQVCQWINVVIVVWCYHHFLSKAALYQLQYNLDVYWHHNASLVCPLETPETSQSSSAHHLLLLGYRIGYPCLQIHPLWKGNVSESQTEHVKKFRTLYHFHNFVFIPPPPSAARNSCFSYGLFKTFCIWSYVIYTFPTDYL